MEIRAHTGWGEERIRNKLRELDDAGRIVRVRKAFVNLAGVNATKTAYKVKE